MPTVRPSVRLVGEDGNVFSIIGRCVEAARNAGWSKDEIDNFRKECRNAQSYDDILRIIDRDFLINNDYEEDEEDEDFFEDEDDEDYV